MRAAGLAARCDGIKTGFLPGNPVFGMQHIRKPAPGGWFDRFLDKTAGSAEVGPAVLCCAIENSGVIPPNRKIKCNEVTLAYYEGCVLRVMQSSQDVADIGQTGEGASSVLREQERVRRNYGIGYSA